MSGKDNDKNGGGKESEGGALIEPVNEVSLDGLLEQLNRDDLKLAAWLFGGPAKQLVGLLGGDFLRELRKRNLEKLRQRTQEIFEDRKLSEEKIENAKVPLLTEVIQAAQDEPSDELIELWARLLAAAADENRASQIRGSFIDTIRDFDPYDALVLNTLHNVPRSERSNLFSYAKKQLEGRDDAIIVSVEHLAQLNCLAMKQGMSNVSLTAYGRELIRVLKD